MVLLFTLRRRVPDPSVYDDSPRPWQPRLRCAGTRLVGGRGRCGPAGDFFRYAVAASLTTGALVTFGIIGYHLTVEDIVPVAAVPLLYAAAMAVEAVAALVVGCGLRPHRHPDPAHRPGPRRTGPALALGSSLALVVVGVLAWGFAQGVQDSTVKAVVADLVDAPRRATAYGVFAGIQGAFAIARRRRRRLALRTLARRPGRGRGPHPAGRAGAPGWRRQAVSTPAPSRISVPAPSAIR